MRHYHSKRERVYAVRKFNAEIVGEQEEYTCIYNTLYGAVEEAKVKEGTYTNEDACKHFNG